MEIKKPGEIIKALAKEDQQLLNKVLGAEKKHLHIEEIKNNSRVEKDIVAEITKFIDEAVRDDN